MMIRIIHLLHLHPITYTLIPLTSLIRTLTTPSSSLRSAQALRQRYPNTFRHHNTRWPLIRFITLTSSSFNSSKYQ